MPYRPAENTNVIISVWLYTWYHSCNFYNLVYYVASTGTGKGFYNGRNSISECSDCLSAVSLKSDLVVGHTSGEFILLKDQGPCSIKIDEKKPMTDTSQINKMDATEASIYCSFGKETTLTI